MTTIYHYHPTTNEYLSSSKAALDPIEKKPLIPAYATARKPLSAKKNQAAVFLDGEWDIVVDFRETEYYSSDGSKQTINELGEQPPKASLKKAPLKTSQQDAIESINNLVTAAREGIAGSADQYKLSNWAAKAEAAKRILNKTATDGDILIIQTEADNREEKETVEALAEKIIAKSDQLQIANGAIEGIERKAIKFIQSARKESTIKTALNKAEKKLKSYQNNN